MRADAQRNAEKLREAAAELFREQGLQVSLREIARRAGVSHGTLFNLFGTREALIDQVVVDLAAETLDEIGSQALSFADPWEGFVAYVEELCAIQAREPMMADVLSGSYPGAQQLMNICIRVGETAGVIIRRAQDAGVLRPDFTPEDLALTFGAVAVLAQAGREAAPNAWRRSLLLVLDGLRTDAARHSLTDIPLSGAQAYEVLGQLQTRH